MSRLTLKQYVVDAFTDTVFKGNPAAVCILAQWLPDALMQNIAKENNLSETAFVIPDGTDFGLRWFTPGGEIDLCGHATLATAYVLMRFVAPGLETVSFHTKSGLLTVQKKQDLYEMDMPAYSLTPVPVTDEMEQTIGARPVEAWLGRDLVCVMESEAQVMRAQPEEAQLKRLDGLLLQLTAPGSRYDCVTRSFAPKLKIYEDPVCGSGHCHVAPLWAQKLGKQNLLAYQASPRSGILHCHVKQDRVLIAGQATLYATAEIFVPANDAAHQ